MSQLELDTRDTSLRPTSMSSKSSIRVYSCHVVLIKERKGSISAMLKATKLVLLREIIEGYGSRLTAFNFAADKVARRELKVRFDCRVCHV